MELFGEMLPQIILLQEPPAEAAVPDKGSEIYGMTWTMPARKSKLESTGFMAKESEAASPMKLCTNGNGRVF